MTFEILGHLIRLQARSALADFAGADQHAAAADQLAQRHERPLVGVFTHWFRALRLAATREPQVAEAAYRAAATQLSGAGMPGVERGFLPLVLLCMRVWHGDPVGFDDDAEFGPYAPWAQPIILVARDRRRDAGAAIRQIPDPPRDVLFEAMWCLVGRVAIMVGDRAMMQRAYTALAPAAKELAGAGSGMLTVGPVAHHLDHLAAALRRTG